MDMMRRHLLKTGMSAAALAALPRSLRAQFDHRLTEAVPPIIDPDVKELALRAVDAARRAGANYADVRLTHTRTRQFSYGAQDQSVVDTEQMVVGARALINGYWGFASGPVWSKDEMDRLGQEAVHQAKANTLGKVRAVQLADTPIVRDGHWATPVVIDPFEVSPYEILDFLASLAVFTQRYVAKRFPPSRYDGGLGTLSSTFQLHDKAFASSDGSFCTQRLYLSEGRMPAVLGARGGRRADGEVDVLTPAGVGWELYRKQALRDEIVKLFDVLERDLQIRLEPVAVGRFDIACNARTVAELVHHTLGPATELDRALGYEANATGTSYLTDPLGAIGTYQAGAPSVTLTANRTERGGAATVQWDDEGVTPDDTPLIKDGVVVDFQTTRESAMWLAEKYRGRAVPTRSHGHACAPSALDAPLQHAPNLQLVPAKEASEFEALVAGMEKGFAIEGGSISM